MKKPFSCVDGWARGFGRRKQARVVFASSGDRGHFLWDSIKLGPKKHYQIKGSKLHYLRENHLYERNSVDLRLIWQIDRLMTAGWSANNRGKEEWRKTEEFIEPNCTTRMNILEIYYLTKIFLRLKIEKKYYVFISCYININASPRSWVHKFLPFSILLFIRFSIPPCLPRFSHSPRSYTLLFLRNDYCTDKQNWLHCTDCTDDNLYHYAILLPRIITLMNVAIL